MLIDEVLSKDVPIDDKFIAYQLKILAAYAEAKFEEAIDIIIEVRRQLGLRTPANKPTSPLIVLKEYIKTSRLLGNRTAEDIASLPKMDNERIIMGQRMLELFQTSSYQCQPSIWPLGVFLLVRASIKHGINASSCDAFAMYGMILCGAFGKFNRGRDMTRAVELLLENPDHRRMQSRATFILETVKLWTAPLQSTLVPLLSGYQKGLEIGDVESASVCLAFRSSNLWHSSMRLNGVVHELKTNFDVIVTHLNQLSHGKHVLLYLFAAKKLCGVDNADIDFEGILRDVGEDNDDYGIAVGIVVQMELSVILQDMDSAENLLKEAGNLRDAIPGSFGSVRFTVLEGLISLKAAQTTNSWRVRRKHKK
ncbi:hypothetical protein ACHAXR_001864, partial [Thalassiosira sp. AJA248-18]